MHAYKSVFACDFSRAIEEAKFLISSCDPRKSVKRMSEMSEDDSVIILSPTTSDRGLSSSAAVTPGSSGGGCYKIEPFSSHVQKRARSFTTSTPKSTCAYSAGNNDTIYLVDDEPDEQPPQAHSSSKAPASASHTQTKEEEPEIIVLDGDDSNQESTSASASASTQKIMEVTEDNEIEIVGVHVVNRQETPRLDRELGPGNSGNARQRHANKWKSRSPAFIPLTRGPRYFSFAPMPMQHQYPNTGEAMPTPPPGPAIPNFISVAEDTTNKRQPGSLRPIVIDGSNVAMGRRGNGTFSCRGIQIVVEFFKRRGHDTVIAFVPQFRKKTSESMETNLLEDMEKQGVIKFTPSREAGGQRIASYDDNFIVQYAFNEGGIIISNDNFKDIYQQTPEWRDTIRLRILQYTWVSEDSVYFPQDPLGRGGPSLDQFLRF